MTARWEPLETAEEVVAAFDAGQEVWFKTGTGPWWILVTCRPDAKYFPQVIALGWKYKTLIEDSK